MKKPHSTVGSRMAGVRNDWLAQVQEPILEPDLAIIDPHHHLWDFPEYPYQLDEILSDTGSGHNIVQTVFLECTACFRAEGPEEGSGGVSVACGLHVLERVEGRARLGEGDIGPIGRERARECEPAARDFHRRLCTSEPAECLA